MSKEWCSAVKEGVRLTVQIAPNAKKSEVAGLLDGVLKLRLQAPPVEGKANEALIRFLSGLLGVPKSAVSLVHGHTSRHKIIEISTSMTVDQVRQKLLPTADA